METRYILLFFVLLFTFSSCEEDPAPVFGCTDVNAVNYNSEAEDEDIRSVANIFGIKKSLYRDNL